MNIEETVFTKLFLNEAIVLEKNEIADKVFHFKIKGDIHFTNYKPGQHLRLLLYPKQAGKLRDRVRTYSVWNYQQSEKEAVVDLAICTHSDGPGSRWAKESVIGTPIFISNPVGKFTLEESKKKIVFIGDVTTLAHYYCFRKHLKESQSIKGIIFGTDELGLFPDFDGSHPFTFLSLKQGNDLQLLNFCRDLNLDNESMIYVGGEGNACIKLHKLFLKDLGIPRKQLKVKPFWIQGKTGLE
ncbi:siderophore-interacting protein [Belliella marina]|uniref:Siderophore-interacting protein n=1 Tax=Belliella marina TaxID=1644146 RepID=A0ABW4VKK3_9BACT